MANFTRAIVVASLLATTAVARSKMPRVGVFTEDSLYNGDGSIRYFSQDVLLKQVGQTLVESSPFGEFYPGLAKSWSFSKDRLTISFTLRTDVAFHSGTTLDAPLVVRALSRRFYDSGNIIHEILSRYLAGFEQGKSTKTCPCLEAISRDRIALRLNRPFNAMIALLSSSNAVILNPDSGAKDLIDGTGPYTLRRIDGDYLLEPFGGYKGSYPASNRGFRIVTASNAEAQSSLERHINAGSIDYAFTPSAAAPKGLDPKGYIMRPLPMMARIGMYFNTRTSRMSNEQQRAAMFNLLRRFAEDNPFARSQPANDIFPRGMMGYKSRFTAPPTFQQRTLNSIDIAGISPDIYGELPKLREYLGRYGITMRYHVVKGDYVKEFKGSTADVFVMGNSDPFLDPSASVGMLMQMDVLAGAPSLKREFLALYEDGITAEDGQQKIARFSAIGDLVVARHIYLPLAQPSVLEFFRTAAGIAQPPTRYRYAPMLSELRFDGAMANP